MIIVKEKENLDEMALQVVSSRKDGLPFRIVIKSPDHQPPHAHIMDLKTGKTELGLFEISKSPPRSAEDIKGYKQNGFLPFFVSTPYSAKHIPISKLRKISILSF